MMILIPITFQEETDLIFETKVKKGRSDTIWRKKVLQEGLHAKKKKFKVITNRLVVKNHFSKSLEINLYPTVVKSLAASSFRKYW